MAIICRTCGDEGFVEALIYCDSCKTGAVHCYCCGISPVPIDDYVTWFCSDCEGSDTGSGCKDVDTAILRKTEKKKKKKKKKYEESNNHTPPVLDVEHNELQYSSNVNSVEVSSSPPIIETMEEPERREISDSSKSNELTGLVGNEASVSEKSEKEKKKKNKRMSIGHSLPDATNVESVEVSKKRDNSDTGKSDELTGLASNEISVLEKSEKKKKKKNKSYNESSNHTSSPVLEAEGHGLQDTTNVEAMKESKKQKCSDSRESEQLNGLVRNEVSVLEKSRKMKKKKKKKKKKTNKEEEKRESSNHTSPVLDAEGHGFQDATSVEDMKESKKRKCSDSRELEELNGLVRNEVSVLEKSEKKKMKKTNKGEEKKSEESSNHTSPVLDAEDHGLQDTTSAERIKESKKRKTSDRNSDELNYSVRNKVSVLEKCEKKKMKKTNMGNEKKNEGSSNQTSSVLDAEDQGLQDTTSAEPMNESKKRNTSYSRNSDELNCLLRNRVSVLGKSEKKKKSTMRRR